MLLSDICLTSVAYIGPKTRRERSRKTKIGKEVAHVTRDSDTTFRVKGQGHQAALVGCSSHYIMYIDETSLYAIAQSEPLPIDHEYSWHTQGTLGAADVRSVGYGLEVGCSGRGGGILCRYMHSLL